MFKGFFNRTKKKKYLTVQDSKNSDVPTDIMTKCPRYKKIMYTKELAENLNVCFNCDHHIALTAYKRIKTISDEGSLTELDRGVTSTSPLDFPSYLEKVEKDQRKTGLKGAVVTGTAQLNGMESGVTIMDSRFRVGSVGSVINEKVCRIIDYYTENHLPSILFSASDDACMRKGIIFLMQMGKASVSLKRHSDAGLLYISCSAHPTTGDVSASFALVGGISLSEPKVLIGFADRQVIERTISEKLPNDFQTVGFLLEHGQLDKAVHRSGMRQTLSEILKIRQEGTK